MAKALILQGKVQGVACRHYCSQIGRKLNIRGSATNLHDGSVRVILDTDDESLVKKYADALKTNNFGFTFMGRITDIGITDYSGPMAGDYNF